MGVKDIIIVSLVAVFSLLGIAFGNKPQTVGFADQFDGFTVQKTITSSAISTTTAQDLTNPATGNLYVDNIVLSTDSTGLAGCTSFNVLVSGNTYGTTVVASNTVANLGANATIDLNSATTKQRIVLENGAKLQYKGVGGTCSGAGKIQATVILKKASNQAQIYE